MFLGYTKVHLSHDPIEFLPKLCFSKLMIGDVLY